MRYIGGKSNLLVEIEAEIRKSATDIKKVIDIFSGSGVVSAHLKSEDYYVIGNDIMYFSYVLGRGTIVPDKEPEFNSLGIDDPIAYLNGLTLDESDIDLSDCFIYNNYSPHDDVKRMYFQNDNAIRIDIIRITIERWKKRGLITEDEYYYLLAALISAVPYVSNIAGVYGAYLKHWDYRTYNPIMLKKPEIISDGQAEFYNGNCDDVLSLPEVKADLLYADPPYNSRQYLPNYHVLETIARYDYPKIHGVTGMRDYDDQHSDFCMKRTVESAFRRMIEKAKVRYVLISYNNEGLLSTEKLSSICQDYAVHGTFRLHEMNYRRYNNIGTKPGGVVEQLYFFEKKED